LAKVQPIPERPGRGLLFTIWCHEDRIAQHRKEGWTVLIRDSEFPVEPSHAWPVVIPQSGPTRIDEKGAEQ